jgi:hypothetical protein
MTAPGPGSLSIPLRSPIGRVGRPDDVIGSDMSRSSPETCPEQIKSGLRLRPYTVARCCRRDLAGLFLSGYAVSIGALRKSIPTLAPRCADMICAGTSSRPKSLTSAPINFSLRFRSATPVAAPRLPRAKTGASPIDGGSGSSNPLRLKAGQPVRSPAAVGALARFFRQSRAAKRIV